jgi:8-oxo-dGTP pyrophosphatase MutT (NUDIX family)
MLPKGRKDIGEELETTAMRETYEETGVRCELLPLSFPTLATSPAKTKQVGEHNRQSITEPFAVTQRTTGGKLKIIFWYAAQADSAVEKVEGILMDGEDFDTVWVDAAKVAEMLTFEDDRAIVSKAMKKAFRQEGMEK